MKAVLLQIINDENLQTTEMNKIAATGYLNDLCGFENIIMLKIWHSILIKFEHVNKMLQKSDLNLSVTVQLYRSLISHCENLKSKFNDFFVDAKSVYLELDAEQYTSSMSRSAITLENMEKKCEELENRIFTPVIESLITNLKTRMNCYVEMDDHFSFLTKLNELDLSQISLACQKIASFYTDDVDGKELASECEIAKQYFFSDPTISISHVSIYSNIIQNELQTLFPNIEILLRIFLSLFITNVAGERPFSKLKYIKNALRNRMTDEKLNAFALMSIENDVLDSLKIDEIIDEFVLLKERRKHI